MMRLLREVITFFGISYLSLIFSYSIRRELMSLDTRCLNTCVNK